jgi:hypothetical protein
MTRLQREIQQEARAAEAESRRDAERRQADLAERLHQEAEAQAKAAAERARHEARLGD